MATTPTSNAPCSKPSANTLDFVTRYITVRVPIGQTVSYASNASSGGIPLDLSGYDVTAPILPRDGMAPPVAAWTATKMAVPPPPDPLGIESQIILSLTSAQTQALGAACTLRPIVWEWCVWLTDPLTLEAVLFERGGLVLFYPLQPTIIPPPPAP